VANVSKGIVAKRCKGARGDRAVYINAKQLKMMLRESAESEKVEIDMEGIAAQGDTSIRCDFLERGASYGD
jgi:hypothetical protein